MSKMVSFRFPEELLERVDKRATLGGLSRSKWVHGALEEILRRGDALDLENVGLPPRSIPCEEVKQMAQREPLEWDAPKSKDQKTWTHSPDEPLREVWNEPQLRCPSSGCDFQAPSPNARCPKHGRRVR